MSEQANSMADRELAKVQAKANLLLALYSHASHELELSRSEANGLKTELADVRREFEIADSVRKDVERLHRQLHEARNERDRATERVAQLEQENAAILNSTSWRITAPIRTATRMAKR